MKEPVSSSTDSQNEAQSGSTPRPGWLSSQANNVWRWLVFFLGDIKRLNAFPWFTWAHHHYLVSFEEILRGLPTIEFGDIGLHRGTGYLSNLFIPGFMKHAWIHVEDDEQKPEIVEALSEGVIKRNTIYPMHSDYTIILTPRDSAKVTEEQRKGACLKANQIVGQPYDDRFSFNIEEELTHYEGTDRDGARRDLDVAKEQIRRYNIAFSCTEVVAYAWWHCREALGIKRKEFRGKSVIIADMFLNDGWRIKWASDSVTVEVAKKLGLGEEGLKLIEEYRQSAPARRDMAPPSRKQLRI